MSDIVKICKVHGELTSNKAGLNRISPQGIKYLNCKQCRNEQTQKRYRSNPEKYIAMASAYNKKHKARIDKWNKENPEKLHSHMVKCRFNLTHGEYQVMLEKQQNLCAICKKPETKLKKKSNIPQMLAVDHCHLTGKVRGLLCRKCNTALGTFKDSIELFQLAIEYLKASIL